jgi:AcrR family transcriptional regulator
MAKTVKRRSYNAANRQASSRETRTRILEVARQAMIGRGYSGTTVAEIAAQAGVSVDTVYELVGRKPVILRELIEQAISGTDVAVVADERSYVKAMRAEPDPKKKLSLYAKAICSIQGRLAPLFLALRDASLTDPEAEEIWREISKRRAANMVRLATDLRDVGGLRQGLTIAEAGDILWATNSSELYVLLTIERHWTPSRYERWLADAWCRLLLRDGDR